MAYEGYLIKVGNYEISRERFIKAKSYSAKLNVQDKNSYRDGNGILHRNVLDHTPLKAEFETPAGLTDVDIEELFGNIESRFISGKERRVLVTAYIPRLNSYVTQEVYMPEPDFPMRSAFKDKVIYEPIRIAFIGY